MKHYNYSNVTYTVIENGEEKIFIGDLLEPDEDIKNDCQASKDSRFLDFGRLLFPGLCKKLGLK